MNALMSEPQITNKTIGDYVQLWGTSASIAILDPLCKVFQIPEIDGIIGYHEGTRCMVVVGDPLCAPEDMIKLSNAFHAFSKERKRNVVYMLATSPFVELSLRDSPKSFMQIADELIVDPANNPIEGSKGRKLRNKISHAQRDGLEVKEYIREDKDLEESISNAASEWLKQRKGPQLYLANVNLFEERVGKRWFYAEKNGNIVGVLLLNRLESKKGWLFNLLMATPEAPWGTSEMLAVKTLEQLRNEDCHYVTFGVVTGDSIGEIKGMGPITVWFAHFGYKLANWFFDLTGRKKYWTKFQPKSDTTYLLLNTPKIGVRDVVDIMRALNAST
jgi:lysylphosphatidylglycerol synthetase-like protein (DUF2156 family)